MALPLPDFEPTAPPTPPTVPVACEITCPQCGYTILTMNREMTEDELDRGLDAVLTDERRRRTKGEMDVLQILAIVGDLMKHAAAQDWEAAAGSVFALIKAIYPLLSPHQQQAVAARAASFGVDEPIDTAE